VKALGPESRDGRLIRPIAAAYVQDIRGLNWEDGSSGIATIRPLGFRVAQLRMQAKAQKALLEQGGWSEAELARIRNWSTLTDPVAVVVDRK
jgi:hypothetical protein